MAYAYSLLYLLENSLRDFIELSLRTEYGDSWMDDCNSSEIIRIASEKKIEEDGTLSILHYTLFPHLRRLIINNWELFEPVFKKQDTIISRLGELEETRHSIAHTRMLPNEKIVELELFYKTIVEMIANR